MTGSAHPLSGKLVTLFGGGGFVGRHVAEALLQAGARVRIAQRHPETALGIRALGALGQTQFVATDITSQAGVRRALTDSDAAVNLVGILKGDFTALHVTAAGAIATAAHDAGIPALVHLSAIGADTTSRSAYGRSKGEGEAAVRAAHADAIILRPSLIFGRQDGFINRFAALINAFPLVPVVAPATRFQPVFVGDVAHAVLRALASDDAVRSKTLDLGGPRILTMRALFEWIAAQIGREPIFIDMPDGVSGSIATLTGWLPGAPITADQWAMLQQDNVAQGSGLAALGVAPTALETVARGWLDIYRQHGRFGSKPYSAA